MTLEYVIRQQGMDPTKDLYVDSGVQFALMAGAFTGGTGDYVALFEPTASAVELEGKGYVLASVGELSGEIPYTCYYAKQSWLKENSDLAQRFTNAIYKGQQWVATHTAAEVAEAIAPFFPDSDIALLEKVCQRHAEASPEKQLQAQELTQAVSSFVRTLPDRHREVFLRRYFYLEDTVSIAKSTGMRQANVRMLLSRIRQKLKQHLIQEGLL